MPDGATSHWKKIAVTGAAGAIGGSVARRLAELGHSLVLLDRTPMNEPPADFVQTDLRDHAAVRAALEGVDAVCHIGEVPNILPGMTGEEVFEINTGVCKTMLDVAREVGVKRFIYTSSCQYYGYWGGKTFPKEKLPEVWPIDERQPAAPMNKYAESKVANEAQCHAAAGAMQVLIYRFPWVVPLIPSEKADRHWANGDRYLFEGFWTYLDRRDAVEAYVCGLEAASNLDAAAKCEAFHFVAEEAVGASPIREKMSRFLPGWPAIPTYWPERQPPVSCEKAAHLLAWRPQYRMSAIIHPPAEQTRA